MTAAKAGLARAALFFRFRHFAPLLIYNFYHYTTISKAFQDSFDGWAVKPDNFLIANDSYRHCRDVIARRSVAFFVLHAHVVEPIHQRMAIHTGRGSVNFDFCHNIIILPFVGLTLKLVCGRIKLVLFNCSSSEEQFSV